MNIALGLEKKKTASSWADGLTAITGYTLEVLLLV